MKIPCEVEQHDGLSERLTAALEAAPEVRIPDGFAVRTAALARQLYPAAANARPLRPRFSLLAARLVLAILAVAMLVCAGAAQKPSVPLFASEALLALEFVALITWLSLRAGDRA
jgi:hypothetical protein